MGLRRLHPPSSASRSLLGASARVTVTAERTALSCESAPRRVQPGKLHSAVALQGREFPLSLEVGRGDFAVLIGCDGVERLR